MKRLWMVLILTPTLFSFGCLQGGQIGATDATMKVEAIYHSTNCPSNQIEPHVLWIDSPSELQRLWKNLHRNRLGGSLSSMPEVDFSAQGIVVVHMGQQTTGGYAIELADSMCHIKNEIASVTINWKSPASGAAVIQMITAPCILLKLQKGDFHSIQVIDQNGRLRATVDIPMGMD